MVRCFEFKSPLCGCFAPRAAEVGARSSSFDDPGGKGAAPQDSTQNTQAHQAVKSVQPHPAAEAHRSGRLAITFSGGGFLLPYFIGVADTLLQLGVLRPGGATPLAGASAGSLIAVSLACGLSSARILDAFMDSVQDCRTKGSYRRLEEVLYRQLDATLPPDAAERCSGTVTVSVTQLFPRPRTRRISTFSSREDLIKALMASCHIPTYFNGDLTTTYRGKRTVDGGVTALIPTPTAPHDFLLKVCCFPRPHVARLPVFNRRRALHQLSLGITPDAFEPWPYSYRHMLAAALHPRSFRFIRTLLEAGVKDASRWAASAGVAEENRLQGLAPLPLPVALAAKQEAQAVRAPAGPTLATMEEGPAGAVVMEGPSPPGVVASIDLTPDADVAVSGAGGIATAGLMATEAPVEEVGTTPPAAGRMGVGQAEPPAAVAVARMSVTRGSAGRAEPSRPDAV